MGGIEATRAIQQLPDPPRVLILTTFDLDEYVYDALRAGASGFLLKDAIPERNLDAVRVVAAGEALLAPRLPGGSSASSPPAPASGRRRAAASSPRASGRSSSCWRPGCRMPRSPRRCTSRSRPSRRTSAQYCSSSGCATGYRPSSSRTSPASSSPEPGRRPAPGAAGLPLSSSRGPIPDTSDRRAEPTARPSVELMIEAAGLTKRYGSTGGRPADLHGAARSCDRLPRPERRREVHDDADDPRPGRPDQRER